MKKLLSLLASLIFAVVFLGSCERIKKDDPKIPEEKKYESEIDFTGWDIAAAGIENEVLKALLKESCPGYTGMGDEKTELFLLGAYANSFDSQIEAVLGGGGACVLTKGLSVETIAEFLEACGLDGDYAKEIEDIEDLEMFGVQADGGIYFAYHHTFSEEEAAEVVTTETIESETGKAENEPVDGEYKEPEESLYSTWEYAALYGVYKWYADILAENKAFEENNVTETVDGYWDKTKANEEKTQKNLDEVIKGIQYTVTHSHTYQKLALPKHTGRNWDYIYNTTLSVILNYKIQQVFVFPEQDAGNSAGDYYVVNCDLEWVNSGMYHGVNQIHKPHATNLRYCGFIPYSCTVTHTPIVADGYTINIPVGGSVLPKTINRATEHTETRSFNIGLNATGGGQGGREGGMGAGQPTSAKGTYGGGHGNATFTAGWGKNHTEKYMKNDWEIIQHGGSPIAGHSIKMDKGWLPEPTYSDPGFEKLRNYGATIDVIESWIWHIPGTKTDGTEAPLKIKSNMETEYMWMDHFKTSPTRITESYCFGHWTPLMAGTGLPHFEKTIPIHPTIRRGAGVIKLTNNMEDELQNELTISNITFVDADSKDRTVVFEDKNNVYANGKEITYTMLTKYKYDIYFKAGLKSSTAKWYKTSDPVNIGVGQTVAISDLLYAVEEVDEEEMNMF